MINNIQVLRAVAAYAVVGHHIVDSLNHYIGNGHFDIKTTIGAAGVDIFFVISGYIMTATTADRHPSPSAFMSRRMIRIIPLYWGLTIIAATLWWLGFSIFNLKDFHIDRVINSFLFIPTFDGVGKRESPVIYVCWTLQYEIFFYTLFSSSLYIRSARTRTLLVLLFLLSLFLFSMLSSNPYVDYWGDGLVLEFGFGMVIWHILKSMELGRTMGIGIIALGCALLVCTQFFDATMDQNGDWRFVYFGIPAIMIVFGALVAEQRHKVAHHRYLLLHGNASYSIYLIHPFVIQFVGKLSILTGLNSIPVGLGASVALMAFVSAVSGVAMHLYIEKPSLNLLREFARGKRLPRSSIRKAST